MRIISSQSFFLYAARTTVISTVDSGAEKSPAPMVPVPPLSLSFRPERSKAEWSGVEKSPPQWHQCLPRPLSFRPERSKAEWSGEISRTNGTSASPSHCHFDRNGAKRSGVEKSPAPMAQPYYGGRSLDSEYQWSSNAFILIPTCSSARDDMLAGSEPSLWEFQSIEAKKKEL